MKPCLKALKILRLVDVFKISPGQKVNIFFLREGKGRERDRKIDRERERERERDTHRQTDK